jgi:cell fate (sporulation/competence/biofilm development) regulator YlbF (YheA/YmcA/DUF963 family)
METLGGGNEKNENDRSVKMNYDKAHELAEELSQSKEFAEMKAARKEVENHPESKELLQDYHAKQMELQAMEMMGREVPDDKLGEFDAFSQRLENDPVVKQYFFCEKKVIDILSDIQKILTDALDVRI